jgi:hypothetical protein
LQLYKGQLEGRRRQIEEGVARHLAQLDTADRQEPTEVLAAKAERIREKIARLGDEMKRLDELEAQMLSSPDQQISLTDPDARSMSCGGRGTAVVGYNVQVAVDTDHHLIVTHEVTNAGTDRPNSVVWPRKAKPFLHGLGRFLPVREGLRCDRLTRTTVSGAVCQRTDC